MADFTDIIRQTNAVIYDNENGGITSTALRGLILAIIQDINQKKLDDLYIKDGNNYYITIGDKLFSLEPYHQTQIIYSDISISSFSYQDISDLGGTSNPIVTYSQTKTTYIDGEISKTETITSGATKTFSANSIQNATLNTSTGAVTCNDMNSGDRRLLGNIKVTVSMNGKTATRDADVYQSQYTERVPDYYVGQCLDKTTFENLTDSEITNNAEGKQLSVTPIYPSAGQYSMFTGNNKLMYVLINQNMNVSLIKVDTENPGGIDPVDDDFTGEEGVFKEEQKTITNDGITYKVYRVYNSNFDTQNGYRIKFNQVL